VIIDVYHVSILSVNLLHLPQLTKNSNKIELCLDRLVVKDINNEFFFVIEHILDLRDNLYKFCDLPKQDI
jgi:hypothetical protein